MAYNSGSKRQGHSSGGLAGTILGVNAVLPGTLGGGINGIMPQATQDVDKTYVNYEQIRFSLKNAWNTRYTKRVNGVNKLICSPFRAVTNSGDVLSRQNYSCGGSCQTFQSRPGMFGLKQHFGAIHSTCDDSGIPPSSCNVKYVYDSSDYIRYKKQTAVNRNYNDVSYGGDDHNSSYVSARAIRRF